MRSEQLHCNDLKAVKMEKIMVKTPATSANLGAGFDICGIALERPFDEMAVSISEKDSIKSTGQYAVPERIDENSCGPVIRRMKEDFGIKYGLEIVINKRIKPGGGLGSSAASAAGIAYSINKLFDLELSKEQLVNYAALGEKISAGVPHLDNVAPCIFGGFTIVFGKDPLKVKNVKVAGAMEAVIILPEKGKTSTKAARDVLPERISRASSQHNLRSLSSLICSMLDDDIENLTKAMDDQIVEPARAKAGILPHFYEIKKICQKFGYGVAASGAGPAILALGRKTNKGKKAMISEIENVFKEKHEVITSGISNDGVKLSS